MLKDNLASLRRLHGYTQEQTADLVGVSRQAYSKWEQGLSMPDLERARKLARLYQISLDDLTGRQDPVRPSPLGGAQAGKHIFGTLTLSEKGQIVIPKQAREIFQLKAGDHLILLGDETEGLALIKEETFTDRLQEALSLSRKKPSS